MHILSYFIVSYCRLHRAFRIRLSEFYYCVYLKSITFYNCLFLLLLCLNMGEFAAKKYFTNHQTANTIHLFIAVKGNCSSLFLF